jgi:hypothetical protein
MKIKCRIRLYAAFPLIAASLASPPASASEVSSTASLIAEVRRAFTINGKPIPPKIFRDFGDGNLADSGPIWVTVDIKAATGSNLYFDDVKQNGHGSALHAAVLITEPLHVLDLQSFTFSTRTV